MYFGCCGEGMLIEEVSEGCCLIDVGYIEVEVDEVCGYGCCCLCIGVQKDENVDVFQKKGEGQQFWWSDLVVQCVGQLFKG